MTLGKGLKITFLVTYYFLICISIYMIIWSFYFFLSDRWNQYFDEEIISLCISTSITFLFSSLLMPRNNDDNLQVRKAYIMCMMGTLFLGILQLSSIVATCSDLNYVKSHHNSSYHFSDISKTTHIIYNQGSCNISQYEMVCLDEYNWFSSFINARCDLNQTKLFTHDNIQRQPDIVYDNCRLSIINELLKIVTPLKYISIVCIILYVQMIIASICIYREYWYKENTWESLIDSSGDYY